MMLTCNIVNDLVKTAQFIVFVVVLSPLGLVVKSKLRQDTSPNSSFGDFCPSSIGA